MNCAEPLFSFAFFCSWLSEFTNGLPGKDFDARAVCMFLVFFAWKHWPHFTGLKLVFAWGYGKEDHERWDFLCCKTTFGPSRWPGKSHGYEEWRGRTCLQQPKSMYYFKGCVVAYLQIMQMTCRSDSWQFPKNGSKSPRKKPRVSASGYERVDVPAALISAEIPRDPHFFGALARASHVL